jgi:putative membrane protein
MYTKSTYKAKEMALWTRYETMIFTAISLVWVGSFYFADLNWLRIPWTPLALIGTAVAFVIGFQNNAAYGRIWEARKIWGGIVNSSRTIGAFVQDMITNEYALQKMTEEELRSEIKTFTYRHIAWMTALRHAMRVLKSWEITSSSRTNSEWGIKPPEWDSTLEEDLKPYLSASDFDYISKLLVCFGQVDKMYRFAYG